MVMELYLKQAKEDFKEIWKFQGFIWDAFYARCFLQFYFVQSISMANSIIHFESQTLLKNRSSKPGGIRCPENVFAKSVFHFSSTSSFLFSVSPLSNKISIGIFFSFLGPNLLISFQNCCGLLLCNRSSCNACPLLNC